jgi:hypothetical protein
MSRGYSSIIAQDVDEDIDDLEPSNPSIFLDADDDDDLVEGDDLFVEEEEEEDDDVLDDEEEF